LIGLVASCAYLALFALLQPTIDVADGRGWDGAFYYAMAESDLPSADKLVPQRYKARVLVPALARVLSRSSDSSDPWDPRDATASPGGGGDRLLGGFRVLNLAAGLLAAVLCWVFLARLHDGRLSLVALGVCWLLIVATPVSPIPESAWYPTQTDAVSNLFLLMALYLALCRRRATTPLACAVVFALGTLTRENFPLFLILFALRFEFGMTSERLLGARNRDLLLRGVGAALGSALAFLLLDLLVGVNPLGGRAEVAIAQIASLELSTVLAALINVDGALLLLLLAVRAGAGAGIGRDADRLGIGGANLALVMGVLVAVSFGWSNTERFLYWSLPIAVVFFATEIDAAVRSGFSGRLAVGLATAFAIVLNRSFVPIEASGVASCSLTSIVDGSSVWLGHWVQICPPRAELDLVLAYAVACAVVAGIAFASRLRRVDQPS
jgi:hypothetical protein